jgi:signal transduction histidine kinase
VAPTIAVWQAARMAELGVAEAEPRHPAGVSLPTPRGGLLANPRARYLLTVVALAALYRGVAQIGYALNFAGPVAAIAWLPVGVGIAFLYLGGLRLWPGVLVGDLLANDYDALPLGSALGQTCGNVLEVLAAAALLRVLLPNGDPLDTVRGLARMLVAIVAGTAVSATIGTGSLLLGDVVEVNEVDEVWRTWWLGDASGALIVLPLALAWAKSPADWWRRHGMESCAALALVAGVSVVAMHRGPALTYLVFLPLLWAALRLGRRTATVGVAIAAGFAIAETTRRVGPFAYESITESVLATQLYLAVSALSTLCVAAAVAEREAFAAGLAASRARLAEAGAAERRRIGHDLHDGAQQRLTAVLVHLRLAAEAQAPPDATTERLASVEEELAGAIEELRELAHGIHPAALREHGLAHALEGMAQRSPIPVRLHVPAERCDPTAEITAYFIVSEALANAHKHAGATVIDVRVAPSRDGLRVEVADDGRGHADERAGSGLQGLRDRVEAIGGSFKVVSRAGRGTQIVALLPGGCAAR